MNRFLLLFFALGIVFNQLHAQDLYKPRDIQQAYQKGSRSADGHPGKNYWQNHARYKINITSRPPQRGIQGTEEITYFNNSPDSLRNLVFKMIVNVHKPTAGRLSPESPDYITSGITIDSFKVNGKSQAWKESPYYNTVKPVKLDKALASKDSVHLFIKWHYDVSLKSNREGMIDSTTYFLAYFYPRVAVYDDYEGWDDTEFNEALEFYNDFNDYSVNIQVPPNYLVWGTGTLLNADKVLQPPFAAKYKQSLTTDQVLNIVSKKDLLAKKITAQVGMNNWQYTARNISDVAFGISDHYLWDASSVMVDSALKRRASVQAAYNDTAADFHHMVKFGREALSGLSANWPGIPYPFEKTTIFQGYAGMEYPMMANDETYPDTLFSRFVADHEIAHSYMPFYMGINETRYGFMDEGWATTFELLRNRQVMGVKKADAFYRQFRVNNWIHDKSANQDMPIITQGPNLNGAGLGSNQYGKPSLGYLAVKEILGDALFKKCLHEYMNRWHGKHPIPWDFFNTFNNASGQNLDWFWNNWFFSNYYIDLGLQNVAKAKGGYTISVQNIGGMAAPFDLQYTFADNKTETVHYTPLVWKADPKLSRVQFRNKKELLSVKILNGIFMDADESNNNWTVKK